MTRQFAAIITVAAFTVFLSSQSAEATLCRPNHITQDHRSEAQRIYDEPFGKGNRRGVHDYNARVIGCNRWRDSIGKEIDDIDPEDYTYPRTMRPRIIKGSIRYFNVAPKRYGYRLERQDGVWILTAIAEFHFPSNKFPNRLDIPMALADDLGIANTVCNSTQRKFGGIDRGLVQIDGWPDACRVNRNERINGIPVTRHLMEYWREVITTFWTHDGFRVRLLIVNRGEVPDDARDDYRKIIWPIRLNHNKNSRAMYRAAPHKPHPLYTGLDGAVIAHEFGHVIGLDDEYPGSNNPPDFRDCPALGGDEYVMCDMPSVSWASDRNYVRGVYPWIVTRRYGFGEQTDLDPVERPRTADARERAPEPHEEERTASGEYTPPPDPSELVDEETRALANLDPTDTEVEASPTDDRPVARTEDLDEGVWRDPTDDSLAQRDVTKPDQDTLLNPREAVERSGNLAGNATRLKDPEEAVERAGNLAGNATRLEKDQATSRSSAEVSRDTKDGEATGQPTGRAGSGSGIGGRLIAHFPLDGSPDNVLGEPGLIHSPEETPPQVVPGKFGQAYRFGEDRAVIAAPLDIDFETYPKLTITAWVKLAAERDASGGIIVSSGGRSGAPVLVLSHNRIRAHTAGSKPVMYEGEGIPKDTWTLVAGVWDYENQMARLYAGEDSETFNKPEMSPAKLDEEDDHQRAFLSPEDEDDPEAEAKRFVFIGALDFSGGWVAEDVAIDDVRIYSGALDDQAIAAIRGGGPVRVAGRDRIGETEKNTPGQPAALPGVPQGVQEDLARVSESEAFQEMSEAQRKRRELEDQLNAGGNDADSAPGVPSSVSEATERFAQSEEFQEAADAQRQRQEVEELLGSGESSASGGDTGGDPQHTVVIDGTSGAGRTWYTLRASGRVDQVDGRLDGHDVTRNPNDTVDGNTARGLVGNAKDGFYVFGAIKEITLDNPGAATVYVDGERWQQRTASRGDTDTRRQALESDDGPLSSLGYGDRVYGIGDISGTDGSYSTTRTFFDDQAILSGISTGEESDKPCEVSLKGAKLVGDRDPNDVEYRIENCRKGNRFHAFVLADPPGGIGEETDYRQGIVGLQVCQSGNRADKRVKGVRVTTRRIEEDGSLGTNTRTKVLFERQNCGQWTEHSACSGGTVATGAKVFFADGTQLAPKDYLSGLALMCSKLEPQN